MPPNLELSLVRIPMGPTGCPGERVTVQCAVAAAPRPLIPRYRIRLFRQVQRNEQPIMIVYCGEYFTNIWIPSNRHSFSRGS